jgi:hypothetical protein
MDLQTESARAPGDRLPDPSEADDPEHGAVHVPPQVLVDVPARPSTAAQVRLRLPRPARRGQDEQEGEVGGRLVEHARRVAHRDAELGRGVEVDVVVADGDVRDDAQAWRARRKHGGVDAIREQRDDRVGVGRERDDLVVAEACVPVGLDELVAGFRERVEAAGWQAARDQDARQSRFSARCS